MQFVDANVLLYAVDADAPQHPLARTWLDTALAGAEPIAFTWVVLLAFLRVATNRAVYPRPLTIDEAAGTLELWLDRPAAVLVHPGPRHLAVLRGLLDETGVGANLVNDAHLVALALENSAGIVSFDRDFGRFPELRWRLPE